jgi:hypothetical protein
MVDGVVNRSLADYASIRPVENLSRVPVDVVNQEGNDIILRVI